MRPRCEGKAKAQERLDMAELRTAIESEGEWHVIQQLDMRTLVYITFIAQNFLGPKSSDAFPGFPGVTGFSRCLSSRQHIRDGWKIHIRGHEALMIACCDWVDLGCTYLSFV